MHIDTVLHELSYSLRMMAKRKTFAVTAIVVLAVGIGSVTAVFSIVDAVLLRPAPFPDPDRLVQFVTKFAPYVGTDPRASLAAFNHWRVQPSVDDCAIFTLRGTVRLTEGDTTVPVRSARVSSRFFHLFGAQMIVGRSFAADEDRPGGAHVVVIGHEFWTTHFASDPKVVGQTLLLNGVPHVIVGVVGPSFSLGGFADMPAVWLPFQADPTSTDQSHGGARVAARLKPRVTLAQAQAQVQVSTAAFRARFPNALHPGEQFSVERYQDAAVADVRDLLLVFVGAVGCVLLIACTNVAGLLLVRGISRRREVALRTVLGASRGVLIRQLVIEGLVLWMAGGILGLGLGFLSIRVLLSIDTAGLPRVGEAGALVELDWRVVGVALGAALLTGTVFSLFPAVRAARVDPQEDLKEAGSYTATHRGQKRLGALLIVGEVTLAVLLLIGSGLLIRSQVAMLSLDFGFDPEGVLVERTVLTAQAQEPHALARLVENGLDRLRAVPTVVAAAASCCLPYENGAGLGFRIPGHPVMPDGQNGAGFTGAAAWASVAPGYFEVLRIPLLRGRTFSDRDTAAASPVAIIDEAMAKQFWAPGEDPLSSHVVMGKDPNAPVRQIVGVVGAVYDGWVNVDHPGPHMYVPLAQESDRSSPTSNESLVWLVRTTGRPSSVAALASLVLRRLTGAPPLSVRAMTDIIATSRSRARFNMLLMTAFGAVALLLAAIGVYGLIANVVAQQAQEIGIRRALGATPRQVESRLVAYGLMLLSTGALIGVIGASSLTRLLAGWLFRVRPLDTTVFVAIPVVLIAVGLCAVWIPARRTRAIDPVIALRQN
jgi:predicted permease